MTQHVLFALTYGAVHLGFFYLFMWVVLWIHELGHALMALVVGYGVKRIEIGEEGQGISFTALGVHFSLAPGVVTTGKMYRRHAIYHTVGDFLINIAGGMITIILAIVSIALGLIKPLPGAEIVDASFSTFAATVVGPPLLAVFIYNGCSAFIIYDGSDGAHAWSWLLAKVSGRDPVVCYNWLCTHHWVETTSWTIAILLTAASYAIYFFT